jgi:proteasome lid subunit RPN8/RPN11
MSEENEKCGVIIGHIGERFWAGSCLPIRNRDASPISVAFDAEEVLDNLGLIGFWHTHPSMPAVPSARDNRTFHAWVGCEGHPLVCVIDGVDGRRAFWFANDESGPEECLCETIQGDIIGLVPQAPVAEPFSDAFWYCQDCDFVGHEEEFVPSDGNPAPHICPECGRTNCFEKDEDDEPTL